MDRQKLDYAVVIPAWNAAETIEETLRSVAAQSRPADEVIIVDDGSTDDTLSVARKAHVPFRPLRQEAQEGPGAATTLGIRSARTTYIAFLDSDDLWLPDKMERQLSHLAASPGIHGVFGHWQAFHGSPDRGLHAPTAGWSRTTLVVRKDVADAVGPMVDLAARVGDMIDWIQRAREQGYVLEMLPDVVAYRRVRPGSLSDVRTNVDRNRGYLAAARNALLRRQVAKAGK
ncbi:glycosyltransferase family 2 protein [Aquibium carbonis]|uniref:Glycosyltransferase family 2 protein n=1 Tax=Aquibium carbonis TaxID=2495581 RepID=A0A3S0AU82_9HYPH|nr:glycosyltransferase family A protein [Aquibium carbonis]RST87205.1 glycosyltransferase family 2 protein [Aquibium carbonis]